MTRNPSPVAYIGTNARPPSMMERIARAMYESQDNMGLKLSRDQLGSLATEMWLRQTRAALDELEKPSVPMIAAGVDGHTHRANCATDYGYDANDGEMVTVFQDMIRAAKDEK